MGNASQAVKIPMDGMPYEGYLTESRDISLKRGGGALSGVDVQEKFIMTVSMTSFTKTRMRLALAIVAVCTVPLRAAEVVLQDGSRLVGQLESIEGGVLVLKPSWGDAIRIPQAEVVTVENESPATYRLRTGEVLSGEIRLDSAGPVIVSASAEVVVPVSQIEAAWLPGAEDPAEAARVRALEAQVRRWTYQLGFDLSGSAGNAENLGTSVNAQAKLEGPSDRLLLYGSYNYKETDGLRSADEQKAGMRYTNFFGEKMGWFVREELERDTFEGVDFRSTTALGLSYRFIKRDRLSLEGSAGLSYRYDSYSDVGADNVDFPGLDFGADLGWQFADWGKLVTKASYIPSFEDLGDYIIEQETGVDVPLGVSDAWVMRFGLSNQYNSRPSGNREKLDTTWFARLLLNWE
jgi:putative salt-induced outer membrane protein YdiY